MLRQPLLAAALTLLLALGSSAHGAGPGAGIADQMQSLFNTMTNATDPAAHLGQRRGAFSGGSFVARNRIMNESLWSVVPPSFEAGCGGIDLFAGSFSFISGEQFQQLLRSIAANAPGYAFQVALENMCPDCMRQLADLQKKLQALNQGFANSCQLAKGIVNDVASAFDLKHKDDTSLLAMVKGVGDVFETRSTASGQGPIEAAKALPAADRAKLQGNLVWQALKRRGAAGAFVGGDDTLLEAIMSVSGTVIVGLPEAAPDGQGDNHRITYLPGNLISASDLLNGTRDREALARRDNNAALRFRMYQCDDRAEDACLNPVAREDTVAGMTQRVKDVLIGVREWQAGAQTQGMVQKFRFGDLPLTPAELAFMEYAPNGIGQQIRTLARLDEGAARIFVEEAAPVIALEMIKVIMNDLLTAARQAGALNAHAYAKALAEQIDQARQQLDAEYQVLHARHGNPQTLLAHYRRLKEELQGPPRQSEDAF
jgi:conjugative transfer pilus assembly protein TraH